MDRTIKEPNKISNFHVDNFIEAQATWKIRLFKTTKEIYILVSPIQQLFPATRSMITS